MNPFNRCTVRRVALPSLLSIAVTCLTAVAAPPPAPGYQIPKGNIPYACTEGDFNSGASAYGTNYGYYYSAKLKQWVSTAWCFPVWGYLAASQPQIVTVGEAITVYATPKDGSNSTEYAPQTASISWNYPGKIVSGCGPSDLACTFIPFTKGSKEWQWVEVHVTMPRTFFIDHPGSNCAGQHICAGFSTNAWTFVGTPPCDEQSKTTVQVSMKNKTFVPSQVLVTPGTKIQLCNDDPFPQRPYTPDNSNWGNRKLQPGKCITFTVPKTLTRKRGNIQIFDAIHTRMRLKIVIEKNAC